MKLIIAGSRNITEYFYLLLAMRLQDVVNEHEITEIVSGRALGVDRLGERYAHLRGIPVKSFPADWNLYGRSAGVLRNNKMARYADAAVIVWDGQSRGTSHMIAAMKLVNKPCYVYTVRTRMNSKNVILATDPQDKLPCGCGVQFLTIDKRETLNNLTKQGEEISSVEYIMKHGIFWQCRNHPGQEIVRSRRLI